MACPLILGDCAYSSNHTRRLKIRFSHTGTFHIAKPGFRVICAKLPPQACLEDEEPLSLEASAQVENVEAEDRPVHELRTLLVAQNVSLAEWIDRLAINGAGQQYFDHLLDDNLFVPGKPGSQIRDWLVKETAHHCRTSPLSVGYRTIPDDYDKNTYSIPLCFASLQRNLSV